MEEMELRVQGDQGSHDLEKGAMPGGRTVVVCRATPSGAQLSTHQCTHVEKLPKRGGNYQKGLEGTHTVLGIGPVPTNHTRRIS